MQQLFKTFVNPIDGVTPIYDGTEIKTATLNAGGSGWVVGDLFTVTVAAGLPAIGKVLTINAGAVNTFVIPMVGYGYAVANGITCTKVSGTGTGLVINITALQTMNGKFAHSKLGNDTNAGTRNAPVQSLTTLATFASAYRVATGYFTENPTFGGNIIIFEGETFLNGTYASGNSSKQFNIKCKKYQCRGTSQYLYNCRFQSTDSGDFASVLLAKDCFINEFSGFVKGNYRGELVNQTILSFKNYTSINSGANTIWNSGIIPSIIDLYRYSAQTVTYPIFKYFLFRKATLWKWNGATISINWITNPNTSVAYTAETLIERVWNSLYYYANAMPTGNATQIADRNYFLLMIGSSFLTCPIFYFDSVTGQTCKVIDDSVTPIFNRYNGSVVLDYTLSTNHSNEALTMGDPTLAYQHVGCYRPNIGGSNSTLPMVWGSVINVNADGTDDMVTPPTLLEVDGDGRFLMNQESTQYRNRIRSNVLRYDRGNSSFGGQAQLDSVINSGFWWGKRRKYSATEFPIESVEAIIYDNETTPSAFPRLSVPINDECRVYWWVSTARIGNPVLFNQLSELGITLDADFLAEYGTWAVTSADLEFYMLTQLTSYVGAKTLNVSFIQAELNANYKYTE